MIHAENSVKKYGGRIADYLHIHDFLDSTKSSLGDVRHRAILHNAFGVFICEKVFGHYIEVILNPTEDLPNLLYATKKVSVRDIAEDHIVEDVGYIPSIQDWLKDLPITDWMLGRAQGTARRAAQVEETTKAEDAVSSNTEDFMKEISKYEAMKSRLAANAKDILTNAAEVFFKEVPTAKAISWLQYTPYFNDGEACTFNVHDPFVLTEEELEDDIRDEYETKFNSIDSAAQWKRRLEDKPDDKNYQKWYEEALIKSNDWPDKEKAIDAWSQFKKVFQALDEDFMLQAFDDHVQVWLRSDGTSDTEEYSHD